jgi:uncharacterized membrane protein (UPF0127 family)
MREVALHRTDGGIVCERCRIADKPWTRMRGLLGRTGLARDEGLLLRPAGSVHTAFMRFPIDAVFLDRELRVVHVARSLPPWRAAGKRGAKLVVELAAGECSRRDVQVGDALQLVQRDGQSSRVIAQRSWSRQRPPILRYRGE